MTDRRRLSPLFMVALMAMLLAPGSAAAASSLRIVAVGASNTSGWGVGADDAYPAQLERLLRSRGIDASVTNAGVPFDTTIGMRVRLDSAVPDSTDLVILQPGANDRRFFGPFEQRASNIAAMVSRLEARRIKVIVYDEVVPDRYYAWDGIHFNVEGHAMIADYLLRQILATIAPHVPLAGSAARKR